MATAFTVEPPQASWGGDYEAEAAALRQALGPALRALHHIGSTSIPGIHAKPVIDMLAEVVSVESVDRRSDPMLALGYEIMGEFGIPGRRYFRKDTPAGRRTHQVHAFAQGSPHLTRHLAFRDYLRAHPETAREYSDLKRKLAATCRGDMHAYMDGKDPFIKTVEAQALLWAKKR